MRDKLLEQVYTEGFLDRIKAKKLGKQAEKEAGVGLGLKVKNKAVGMLGGTMSGKQAKTLSAGSIAKSSAQTKQLTDVYMQRLKSVVEKFKADLAKLNIDATNIEDDSARKIVSAISKYGSNI